MATSELHPDFNAFLSLLNEKRVDYLLIGGYVVNYYGYDRVTDDLDVWIAIDPTNADRIVAALREFGFDVPMLKAERFLIPGRIIRMGRAPVRIEICNHISGVSFEDCRARATIGEFDGLQVPMISLPDLRKNKKASGRPKDMLDLDHLPEA